MTKPILRGLGQDESVIGYAHTYVMVSLPGAYFLSMFDATKRFLNCLKISWVPMIAQVGATLLHVVWCHIFVVRLDWGLSGLGMASTITSLLLVAMTEIYAQCLPHIHDCFFWPDATSLSNWREYFALGVPTTIILCAECFAWQFLGVFSGHLGVQNQATMMILMQIAFMINTTCLGMQEAACVLIGNQIGAMNVVLARRYAKYVFVQAALIAIIVSGGLFIRKDALIRLFTTDEELIAKATFVIPLFCFTNLADMTNSCFIGCVRALGTQANIAMITILCFYLGAIPLAALFAFVFKWELLGLWLGFACGIIILASIVGYMTMTQDWQEIVIQVGKRINQDRQDTLTLMGENYLDRDRDLADFFSEAGEFDYERQSLLKSSL